MIKITHYTCYRNGAEDTQMSYKNITWLFSHVYLLHVYKNCYKFKHIDHFITNDAVKQTAYLQCCVKWRLFRCCLLHTCWDRVCPRVG